MAPFTWERFKVEPYQGGANRTCAYTGTDGTVPDKKPLAVPEWIHLEGRSHIELNKKFLL